MAGRFDSAIGAEKVICHVEGNRESFSEAINEKNLDHIDKFIGWRRLGNKDREKVMDNIASHEDWKSCFSEIGPGLLLFARQWTRSAADAEDIVQEAFVKFWRRNHKINNRALLYATVRSIALDFIRRDKRRARREATAVAEADPTIEPQFEWADEAQSALAAAVELFATRSTRGARLENLERTHL